MDRIILYKVTLPNPVVSNMIEVLEKAIKLMEKAFKMLSDVEDNRQEILACCEEIMALEKECDTLYRQAVAALFHGQYDAMTIIKWKEIFEHIETTLDRCEDVGNLISGICIKYS